MTMPARYEAFWVPGLDHDIDRDDSLRVGLRWLADAERTHKATGAIVMYAKSMAQNAPLLGEAARRWEFVSPRSRKPWGRGPILAIWPPDAKLLEFAESLPWTPRFASSPGITTSAHGSRRRRQRASLRGSRRVPPDLSCCRR